MNICSCRLIVSPLVGLINGLLVANAFGRKAFRFELDPVLQEALL